MSKRISAHPLVWEGKDNNQGRDDLQASSIWRRSPQK